MTRRADDHPEVIKDLKAAFPDVEEARKSCVPPGVPYVPAAELTYHPDRVVEAMCENARELPLEEKVDRKVKTVQPSWGHLEYSMSECDREGIRAHYLFRRQKGPDMLLLESGCQVPVMDRWMLRRMLKPTPEQEERFQEDVLRIQKSSDQYGLVRDAVIEEANECQVPVGEHHVSCWLEMLFGNDRGSAERYLNELIDAIKEPEA
ncbi:MAG: hypothetical protein JRC90_12205 [Deltaproteobacteria bacterium]|nr:hypothetical protein [Deltaproteobacteria bacterium]